MSIQLSIIIVSFNTKELLLNCIESINSTCQQIRYEIIVVDNGSYDDSVLMINTNYPDVKLITNNTNTGFSTANNQGIMVSSGEYILLLNSDTLLTHGAIKTLVEFMDEHPEAAAVGPKVLNFDGSLQNKGFYFPSIFWAVITLLRLSRFLSDRNMKRIFPHYCWGENDTKQVDWVSGCCMLISRISLSRVGFLSEDFFLYSEEVEWCYRAYKNGYKIYYLPTAQIYHLNQASPVSNRSDIFTKSKIIFYKKTIGKYKATIILVITILSHLINYMRMTIIPYKYDDKISCINNIKYELKVLALLYK